MFKKLWEKFLNLGERTKCQKCSSALVSGPNTEREAEHGSITVKLKHIPTRVCSSGCPGSYWYSVDYVVEIFDAVMPESAIMAVSEDSSNGPRHLCTKCSTDLVSKGMVSTFHLRVPLYNGSYTDLEITAPSLTCLKCQTDFLP